MRILAILLLFGGTAMADDSLFLGNSSALSLKFNNIPSSFTFSGGEKGILFTIKPDGTIIKGPAFTTTDEGSLEFWKAIDRAFPSFKAQIIEDAKSK